MRGYCTSIYKYLRYSGINGFMAPREALKGRMLQVAKDGRYESPMKALLFGLRLAEKMAIIPAIKVLAEWMFAESLVRVRISRNLRNIRWVEGDIIRRITKRKERWEWKELECLGLAVPSLMNLLRIGEAWTVSSPGAGKLCFLEEKSRSGEHDQDLGPWPSRWMRFIKEECHKRGVAEDHPHWLPVTRRFGRGMGHTHGGIGARTLQMALSAESRGDTVVGVGRTQSNSSCSQVGGNHRQRHGITQNQSMHGSSWRGESSRCRYVEKMGIASCMGTGPPSSSGQHGCEKSLENWRRRHGQMAMFWDRLDRPPAKGEGPDQQGRQGQSRRRWAHNCRMGKIAELGEDMDLVRVHDKVCD